MSELKQPVAMRRDARKFAINWNGAETALAHVARAYLANFASEIDQIRVPINISTVSY
jgi:hypothetical protein